MNFYNPYYFPYSVQARTGFLTNLIKKINLTSIINGTERTLNTVNQIIPLVKEARPLMSNAKTMFKLMSEFNRDEKKTVKRQKKGTPNETSLDSKPVYLGGPTFFQ